MQETLAEQEGVKAAMCWRMPARVRRFIRLFWLIVRRIGPSLRPIPAMKRVAVRQTLLAPKIVQVPLRKGTWDHDVKAMLAAAPNGGLFYICNPNNPTGTLTKKEDIEWLVANKPAGSIVLVDEAYLHISPNAVKCVGSCCAG